MTLSDLAKYSVIRSARGLSATAELLVSSNFYMLYNLIFMWIVKP